MSVLGMSSFRPPFCNIGSRGREQEWETETIRGARLGSSAWDIVVVGSPTPRWSTWLPVSRMCIGASHRGNIDKFIAPWRATVGVQTPPWQAAEPELQVLSRVCG